MTITSSLYIEKVHLKNIRCFESLQLDFGSVQEKAFSAILGDNATGKTTLLKAIAMGVCDESSAAGLMKEADAGYIRRGEKKGKIQVILRLSPKGREYVITTKITRTPVGEHLQQTTDPKKKFPWKKIFVSAYGAGRSTSGTGDIAEYSVLNAVYNLFNYTEGLQNPELSLLRIKNKVAKKMVLDTLCSFLSIEKVNLSQKGLVFDGRWGKEMPLRDLADGYKSGFLWLTDFLGWAVLRNPSLKSNKQISGIVLVDELEQHLHPKWQESVVTKLQDLFPKVQFIIGTHSPVIVSRIGEIGETTSMSPRQLIHLGLFPHNKVKATPVPSVRGWRPDQILASPAFDQLVMADPEIDADLSRMSQLASEGKNNTREYRQLRQRLARHLISDLGTTDIERDLQTELDKVLQNQVDKLLSELLEENP